MTLLPHGLSGTEEREISRWAERMGEKRDGNREEKGNRGWGVDTGKEGVKRR